MNNDGNVVVRTPEWSLPEHLHSFIATIQPTNSFFGPQKQQAYGKESITIPSGKGAVAEYTPPLPNATTVDEVCNTTWVTSLCLRTLYGSINYTVQAAHKNLMALNNFLGSVNLQPDAKLYLDTFRPEASGAEGNATTVSINNGTLQRDHLTEQQQKHHVGYEGNLDEQTMLGIAWPTPLQIYSTGGEPPWIPDTWTPTDSNEPYLAWLDHILSQPDHLLPSVISSSHGDSEQSVPKDYAIQVCNALAQLTARGVTVVFSSGDTGVGKSGTCISNDGRNAQTFLPLFPSTCPYVLSVGGTYQFTPEVPVFRNNSDGLFTGGGGFSNYFDAPLYQSDVTRAYIDNVVRDNYTGLYNPTGRGYPDISAQALNYTIFWNGTLTPLSGTSAAAPTAAAILALVNDALIAAGKPRLGFLNPWLYRMGHRAFNDVSTGSIYGCDTDGFYAADGWDAATGWGTPDFGKILALRMGMEREKEKVWYVWD